jgi:hypothetical protein
MVCSRGESVADMVVLLGHGLRARAPRCRRHPPAMTAVDRGSAAAPNAAKLHCTDLEGEGRNKSLYRVGRCRAGSAVNDISGNRRWQAGSRDRGSAAASDRSIGPGPRHRAAPRARALPWIGARDGSGAAHTYGRTKLLLGARGAARPATDGIAPSSAARRRACTRRGQSERQAH